MRWLTPSNASFLGIAVTWNNFEKATPGLSTVLSRAQIEDALFRQRAVQLLKARVPSAYNKMVDNVVAAQAQGLSWTSSLMWVLEIGLTEDAPEKRKPDDFGKRTLAVAAKYYASEWIALHLLQPLSLLQNENPTSCSEINVETIEKAYDPLYRRSSPEAEKWRSEIVGMQFDIIEIALSEDLPELIVLSPAENMLFEKWLGTRLEAFERTLSQGEINFLRSNKPGSKVSCKYNIFLLTQLRDNRKMANIFLRRAALGVPNPPATAKRDSTCGERPFTTGKLPWQKKGAPNCY
jgi:hypothetical protein